MTGWDQKCDLGSSHWLWYSSWGRVVDEQLPGRLTQTNGFFISHRSADKHGRTRKVQRELVLAQQGNEAADGLGEVDGAQDNQ